MWVIPDFQDFGDFSLRRKILENHFPRGGNGTPPANVDDYKCVNNTNWNSVGNVIKNFSIIYVTCRVPPYDFD
jgi:hypothetical protein